MSKAEVANDAAEHTFDPTPGTLPNLPLAAESGDRSAFDLSPSTEIDQVMGVIAMEEHAASDVAVGPHSKALFGIGPGGLDLPPVQSVVATTRSQAGPQRQDSASGAQIGARAGPGRGPLTVGGTGDSDLEEWSDEDH